MITAPELCRILAAARVRLSREKDTQADIEELLRASLPQDCPLHREVRLAAGDVPDFVVGGGLVVEVKLKGQSKAGIYRQLVRYARHDRVTALILVSNVSMGLPPTIEGKPTYFVSLGAAWI